MGKTFTIHGRRYSIETMQVLLDLGITGHEIDNDNDMYCDIIYLGPLKRRICIDKKFVDSQACPQLTRFRNIKREIKLWHEDLKNENNKPITATEILERLKVFHDEKSIEFKERIRIMHDSVNPIIDEMFEVLKKRNLDK